MTLMREKLKSDEFRILMRKYGIFIVLLIIVVALSASSRTFRTPNNVISVLQQISTNGLVALGMCFVITVGGIDLSVGSMIALVGILSSLMLSKGYGLLVALIVPIALVTVCGFINGFMIAKFNFFPFVVTLAMQLVIRGAGYIVSGGYQIPISNLTFLKLYSYRIGGILPMPTLILFIVGILAYFLLHCTTFGRYVYATGGNPSAAMASGVSVLWIKTLAFTFSGFCASLAGLILTAKVAAGMPNIGTGYEGDAIAACVIGGTSFAGGVATIPGTFCGIIIIGLIYNGMNMLGISSYWQTICKGLLILGAISLDMFMNKRK